MVDLKKIVAYCDERVRRNEVKDFSGSFNGLQFENNGKVSKIGAAVDAGYGPCQEAIAKGIDFLITHHGLFWRDNKPITGPLYQKYKTIMEGNLAVYGSHLPLDCHREIGNNVTIAEKLGLNIVDWFLEYEGNMIGVIAEGVTSRKALVAKLEILFPDTVKKIECGSDNIKRIGICSGSGDLSVDQLLKHGVDTFITGELRQHQFTVAQELGLNLYPCGHYHTEVFGVCRLAEEVANKFGLP